MSTVTSCTLLSSRPAAAALGSSSGGRLLQSGIALPCSQRKSRPLSVCFVKNPKGHHGPKTDLPPFDISPVALVHPVSSPREERWQIEEKPHAVNIWFEVPGLSKEDLIVELDEDVLVIKNRDVMLASAANRVDGSKARADAAVAAAHDGSGVYARLLVPAGYSRECVEAELASGVLRVTIGKVKEHARRRINVDIHVK